MKSYVSVVLLSALLTAPAFAGTRDPGVNHRQARQHGRIEQGVRSGQLTRDEAKSLRAEERAIRKEERQFKADGKLTPAERKQLHKDLNQASKDIYADKHNGDVRPRVK
jgi:Ni/Co efflux regulator RcnB